MSLESTLARGRVRAEQMMTDTCVVEHKTGETTSGGVITPTWATVYSGKCRVQSRGLQLSRDEVGEASRVLQRPELQLPVSATGVREGDRVTMTAAADPELATRVFTVFAVEAKSNATMRRITLISVTSQVALGAKSRAVQSARLRFADPGQASPNARSTRQPVAQSLKRALTPMVDPEVSP